MMKAIVEIFLLGMMTLGLHAETAAWLTHFGDAKKKAKAEDKRLLMLFTGSDWCPYCIKWEKEVFSKPEFLEFAKANAVLLLVDFPEKRPLAKAQQRANDALSEKFNIEMYPTVVALDSSGKKIGAFTYAEGGVPAFVAQFNKLK